MNSKKSKALLGLGLAAMQTLAACSMKEANKNANHVVSISLPKGKFAMATDSSTSTTSFSGSSTPTIDYSATSTSTSSTSTVTMEPKAMSDFNCFAINVRGPGIPHEGRLRCRDPRDAMGIFVGLVPRGGQIDVMIPAGGDREIQLVGVMTERGCPSLNEILDPNFNGRAQYGEMSEPYMLAATRVDVFEDRAVGLRASFNSSAKAFDSCDTNRPKHEERQSGPTEAGWGPELPIVAIHGHSIGVNSVYPSIEPRMFAQDVTPIPSPSPVPSPAPSASPSPTWLTASVDLGNNIPSAISMLPNESDSAMVQYGVGHKIGANNVGYRAAMQIKFDLTGVDFARYPLAALNMRMRGGLGNNSTWANCATGNQDDMENALAVNVGVLNARASLGDGGYSSNDRYWMPLNQFAEGASWASGRKWGWGGGMLNQIPLTEMVENRDGKTFLYVSVESNARSTTACTSFVRVADVHLRLLETPKPMGGNNMLWINAMARRIFVPNSGTSGGSPMSFFMRNNYSFEKSLFYTLGSSSPVTYSIISTSGTNMSDVTIGASTGMVNLGSNNVANGYVNIQASNGMSTSMARLYVKPYSIPVGVRVTYPSGGTMQVGNCHALQVTPMDVMGNNTTNSGPSVNFYIWANNNSGTFYSAAGCSGAAINVLSLAASSTGVTIYFKPTMITPTDGMGPRPEIGGNFDNSSSLFAIEPLRPNVIAGTPSKYYAEPPSVIAQSQCVPLKLYVADSNNFATFAGSATSPTISTNMGSNMSFYSSSNPTCSGAGSPSTLVGINTTVKEYSVYMKANSVMGYNLTLNGSPYGPNAIPGLLARAGSEPIQFAFAAPLASGSSRLGLNTCHAITISARTKDGTNAPIIGQNIIAAVRGLPDMGTAYTMSSYCTSESTNSTHKYATATGCPSSADCGATIIPFGTNTTNVTIYVRSNSNFWADLMATSAVGAPKMQPGQISIEFRD